MGPSVQKGVNFMPNTANHNRRIRRKLCDISLSEQGYTIHPPSKKGLVLSGGGAKGVAYAGLLKSMEMTGNLETLTHISGASAGAMTASLVAMGMNPTDITKIVSELDFNLLLDREGTFSIRAKGERVKNFLDLVYYVQLKQIFENISIVPFEKLDIVETIALKLEQYTRGLKQQGIYISTVDEALELAKDTNKLAKLDSVFTSQYFSLEAVAVDYVPLGNPRISFDDLYNLRELLPNEDKHLIKNLSVVVTNQSKNILEQYNENSTPDQSIAEIVAISGAHPLLFLPIINKNGESLADGGILDNTPTRSLLKQGLDLEEIMCVQLEPNADYQNRLYKIQNNLPETVSRFGSVLDYIAIKVIGGQYMTGISDLENRSKSFYHIGNLLVLNTGEITTTNTSATLEQKNQVIKNAYEQTTAFFGDQFKTFSHPLLAVIYLGVDRLNTLMISNHPHYEYLKDSALHAKIILNYQLRAVRDLKAENPKSILLYLNEIEQILKRDAGLDEVQLNLAMALCVKQIDHLSKGKLQQFAEQETAKDVKGFWSWILDLLLSIVVWVDGLFKKLIMKNEQKPCVSAAAPNEISNSPVIIKAEEDEDFFIDTNALETIEQLPNINDEQKMPEAETVEVAPLDKIPSYSASQLLTFFGKSKVSEHDKPNPSPQLDW